MVTSVVVVAVMVSVSRTTTGLVTVTASLAAGTKQAVTESDFDAIEFKLAYKCLLIDNI